MVAKFSNRELALIADTDVLAHIRARNAELNRQAAEEGWEFWTLHCEDSADEYANVYEYLKEAAIGFHSDVFKDINGFRPRHVNYTEATLEEIESLNAELVGEDEEEEALDHSGSPDNPTLGDVFPELVGLARDVEPIMEMALPMSKISAREGWFMNEGA